MVMWSVLVVLVWVVPWQEVFPTAQSQQEPLTTPSQQIFSTSPPQQELPITLPQQQEQDASLQGNFNYNQTILLQMLDDFKNLTQGAAETRSYINEVTSCCSGHLQYRQHILQEVGKVSAGVETLTQQLTTHLQQQQQQQQPGYRSCGNIVDVLRKDVILRDFMITRLQEENTTLKKLHLRLHDETRQVRREKQEVQSKFKRLEEEKTQTNVTVEQVKTENFRVRATLQEVNLQHKELRAEVSLQAHQALLERGRSRHLEAMKAQLENKTTELEEEKNQQEQYNSQLTEARRPLMENFEYIVNEITHLLQECIHLEAATEELQVKTQGITEINHRLEQDQSQITEEGERLKLYISETEGKIKKVEDINEDLRKRKDELQRDIQTLEGQNLFDSDPCS
ncbi:myosin-6-like isoform X2 [Cherax quadricarinatus]|uniref:myosin-6-like isoform X2 n=1 Tax=Cherax quadricarinatus TaxID=27406 RepID=UPI00387EAA94